jgi:hypothetical protein
VNETQISLHSPHVGAFHYITGFSCLCACSLERVSVGEVRHFLPLSSEDIGQVQVFSDLSVYKAHPAELPPSTWGLEASQGESSLEEVRGGVVWDCHTVTDHSGNHIPPYLFIPLWPSWTQTQTK